MQIKTGMMIIIGATNLIANQIHKTTTFPHSLYLKQTENYFIMIKQKIGSLIPDSQIYNNSFKYLLMCAKMFEYISNCFWFSVRLYNLYYLYILIHMKSLFINSLSRLFKEYQLANKNTHIQIIQQSLFNKFNQSFKIKDLNRLSLTQMKVILKVPCPSTTFDHSQIMNFKRLRHSYAIQQSNVCARCPRADNCPFKNQQPQQKRQAKLQHIFFFLAKLQLTDQSMLRWASAYKVAQNMRIMLRDSGNLKRESQLYHIALKQQEQKQNKTSKTNKKQTKEQLYKNRRFNLTKS